MATVTEILTWVANGGDVPTELDLCRYLLQARAEPFDLAGQQVTWLVTTDDTPRLYLADVTQPTPGAPVIAVDGQLQALSIRGGLEQVHQDWLALNSQPTHPLVGLLKAWWESREIVARVSRMCWQEDRAAECPPDWPPTEADLCEHLGRTPQPVFELDGRPAVWKARRVWGGGAPGIVGEMELYLVLDEVEGEYKLGEGHRPSAIHLKRLDQIWQDIPEPRPPHPLGALIRSWWAATTPPVKPERRPNGIMPAPFVKRIPEQNYLPGLTPPLTPGLVTLPADTAYLPGLEPEGGRREIPALLQMFDAATGGKVMCGGADLPLAILVEGLLSVPTNTRAELRRVGPFTIGEIAGIWLQWKRKHYRPTKRNTGAALRAALFGVNSLTVPVRERGFYFPLLFRGGEGMRWNDRVAFLAQLPAGAEVGPRIDRNVLRVLRKWSAPAYRAYLSLCFDWDYYGGRRGKLALSTRPVAVRNEQGYILTPDGDVVTGKGGVPVKSPYDRRAIRTGEREANPAARALYPEYDADDLVRLCYPASVYDKTEERKKMRQRAKAAVLLVAKVGTADIEPVSPRKGDPGALPWRIMPR